MSFPTAALPFSTSVQFAGVQTPPLNLQTMKVMQEEFCHDMVTMQFWADDADSDSYASGMPMILTFGRPDTKRTFYGYVSHVSRTNNALSTVTTPTDRNSTCVVCVGASFPMKQTDTKSYFSQTASQVVQSIADQFGLAANIVPDSMVWPVLSMAGRSYWQFCVALAKRIGYTFYCSGIQLVFKPRQTNPASLNGLVATYDYRNNPGGLPVFTPILGATSPAGGQLLNRQYGTIDPRTNQIIYSQVTGSPQPTVLGSSVNIPLFNETQHFTANSQSEANAKLSGVGTLNQLHITATATAGGNPLVSQGSLIFVQNANGGQDGLWFVQKAAQSIDRSTYTMDLNLGRDSIGATTSIGIAPLLQSLPVAVLTNGTWVAQ